MMKESLAKLLSSFRFSSGPMETLSLNEARVQENFISQLGAVESLTRVATEGGSLETPFVKLGGSLSSEAGATWVLNDPITQALVLHAALESQGSLHGPDDARPGRYVMTSGVGAISRLRMLDGLHRERLHDHPGLYEKLEAERAKQEEIMHMTGRPEKSLWLLTIAEGTSICAATLEDTSLRDPFRHWAYADSPWEFFGLVRRIHETGVPWLAPLHLYVKL
jgi:lactam utilization protein B